MKIIYARMEGYDWVSVPSDAVARELRNLGHTVTIVDNVNNLPVTPHDIVWSPYESVTILGDQISSKLGIPHFAHVEVIPPWRIFKDCDYKSHGLEPNDPELNPAQFEISKSYYTLVVEAWKRALIKTTSTSVRVPYHQNYFGIDNLHVRYPSIDINTINLAKQNYSPNRENKVLTVTRMTPVKRLDILVEIMNKIKTRTKWSLVGTGPAIQLIQNNLTNENISLEILGAQWGWEKLYTMLSSTIFLYSTGAMPPIEAAICGSMPIVMESQGSKHIPEFKDFQKSNFGDAVPVFEYGDFDKAAKMVDAALNGEIDILKQYDTVSKFSGSKCGVTSSKENAKNIIKLMEEYGINI